jgi:diguanylate cyclase (GGDEF)-like protein
MSAAVVTPDPQPRILIVEDDHVAKMILASILKKEGYSFDTASNGVEAIDKYGEEFFPIIITDWLMPEMDGLELCRLIRGMKIDRYIYIIFVTGQNSAEDVISGLEAGADDYIVKPINHAELRVRLKSALRILDLEARLKSSLAESVEMATHDPLTGAFNRIYMTQHLEQELRRSTRYNRPLSVIMCDLDHFKSVNDTYGHLAGDEILKTCVAGITSSFRKGIDWVARYGGEEFVVVLPETDQSKAMILAERLRTKIAGSSVNVSGCEIEVTASFGVATVLTSFGDPPIYMEQVLKLADTCLYQAKDNGRNQVVSEML